MSLLATLLAALLSLDALALPGDAQTPLFHVEELLHLPSARGVVLSLVPAQDLHLAVAYGDAEPLAHVTPLLSVPAGRRVDVPLPAATPGAPILYRVLVREGQGPRPLYRTAALPAPGQDVQIAVAADTHAWAVWSKGVCGFSLPALQQLEASLENIAADDSLDLLVLGTDIAMTKCGSCSACEVDGELVAAKTVTSLQDAWLRWRKVLQPDLIGSVGTELPLLFVQGDHEGEQGWPANDVPQWSTWAHRAHVPDPSSVYPDSPGPGHYAVRAGDLLLVVLDVHRYTTVTPMGPDDFTLGPAQRAWLVRTLENSDAPFKMVLAEHLLGGFGEAGSIWKGRGGITATDDGSASGTFLGEQAWLQQVLVSYGVQVFLSFQDHVVAWGQKLDADGQGSGVTYVIGGRASGVAPPATGTDWYPQVMDYDGDGVPEYDTDVTGTTKVGYFRISLVDGETLRFEYIRSVAAGSGNGETVLAFEVDAAGQPTSLPLD